jgi:hypothetical protein
MKRTLKDEIKTVQMAREALDYFDNEFKETNTPAFPISFYMLLWNLTSIIESYHLSNHVLQKEITNETINA